MNKSVNPEIHETNKLRLVADEIRTWLNLDWSYIYGNDIQSIVEFRDTVTDAFVNAHWRDIHKQCPLFVDYLVESCKSDVRATDWTSLAIALDNLNGMYYPLRLTRIVMNKEEE